MKVSLNEDVIVNLRFLRVAELTYTQMSNTIKLYVVSIPRKRGNGTVQPPSYTPPTILLERGKR